MDDLDALHFPHAISHHEGRRRLWILLIGVCSVLTPLLFVVLPLAMAMTFSGLLACGYLGYALTRVMYHTLTIETFGLMLGRRRRLHASKLRDVRTVTSWFGSNYLVLDTAEGTYHVGVTSRDPVEVAALLRQIEAMRERWASRDGVPPREMAALKPRAVRAQVEESP